MISLRIVLLILAFIVFCFAALGVQTRINLIAAGLAVWVLAQLVPV